MSWLFQLFSCWRETPKKQVNMLNKILFSTNDDILICSRSREWMIGDQQSRRIKTTIIKIIKMTTTSTWRRRWIYIIIIILGETSAKTRIIIRINHSRQQRRRRQTQCTWSLVLMHMCRLLLLPTYHEQHPLKPAKPTLTTDRVVCKLPIFPLWINAISNNQRHRVTYEITNFGHVAAGDQHNNPKG